MSSEGSEEPIGPVKQKIEFIFLSISLSYVLDAQKNRLIDIILLSTHNICFGRKIKKIIFGYTLLSGSLHISAVLSKPLLLVHTK